MNKNKSEKVWQSVLGEMEIILPKVQFGTWFKGTNLEIHDDHSATIYCPHTYSRDWLKNKYNKQIMEALQKSEPAIKKVEYKTKKQDGLERLELGVTPEPQKPRPQETEQETKEEKTQPSANLNENYTFESLVVGNNNSLAYAVAKEAASQPGKKHNPLFVYGGVGLGKTHLAQAIGHAVLSNKKNAKIVYVSCETFTNDFITAIASKKMADFKKTYRQADVLIVDDIQFLSAKEGSQEEFFHTFNTLQQNSRQTVLTADKAPQAIPALEGRLASRFGGGIVVDIQPPNYETRIAILNSKCQERNYFLPEDVVGFIARSVTTNIRELEGALNRLMVFCQFNGTTANLEIVQKVLGDLVQSINRKTDSAEIINAVCKYYSLEREDIVSKGRKKELMLPRQVAIYLMREMTNKSLPQIGSIMGGKDHSTILHSENKIKNLLETDAELKKSIGEIRQMILSIS
jgi:chromosomal replication initiator protein